MKPTPCELKKDERQHLASLTAEFIKSGGRIDTQPIQIRSTEASTGFNNSKPKKTSGKKYSWHAEVTQIINDIKTKKNKEAA